MRGTRAGLVFTLVGVALVMVVLAGLLIRRASGPSADPPRPPPPRAAVLVVVGDPGADGGTGAVDVHYPDGSSQRLTPAGLGIPAVAGMQFGSSVTVGQLNDDTPIDDGTGGSDLEDLLIGADGGWPAPVTPGGAWLLRRSPDGRFDSSGLKPLPSAGGREGGFGHAVAISNLFGGYEWLGADVWVGAPGTTVDDAVGAGAVHRYRLRPDGSIGADEVLTQDQPQVTGAAEPGDGFGEVLAPTQYGVFVGTPHEDVRGVPDAGVVHRIQTNRRTLNLRFGPGVGRGVGGVPGPAGAHDLFGAAIARDGLLVGIPGATVDGLAGAGAVQELSGPGTTRDGIGVGKLIVRGDGAPGRPASGDRFGSAIVMAGPVGCRGPAAVIGVPGAQVSGRPGAGLLSLISYGCDTGKGYAGELPRELARGAGLPGTPRTNEAIGSTVGAVRDLVPGADALLLGLPGQTVGGHPGTGRVLMVVWQPGATRGTGPRFSTEFGALGGDRDRAAFGSVLAGSSLD